MRTVAAVSGTGPYTATWTPALSSAPSGTAMVLSSLKPSAAVSDYTENVPYTGTITDKTKWLGHVEYATDNVVTSGQSAVSGIVTFKGKATDNQRISKITAKIGTGTTDSMVLGVRVTDPSSRSIPWPMVSSITTAATSRRARHIPGLGQFPEPAIGWTSADGTDYKMTDSSRVALGHVVSWNFAWDSSKLNTVAATSVKVVFTVYDDDNTPQTNSDSITVDVVPYITKVTTNLSSINTSNPSVFNRTALGHYPIAEKDVVTMAGFNLYYSTNTTGRP